MRRMKLKNKHDKKDKQWKKQNKKNPKLRYPAQVSLFLMACAHLSNK